MYHVLQQGQKIELNSFPRNRNLVNFSMFTDLSQPLAFRSFSVKFVMDGCEMYHVNGNHYAVRKGQYLLANAHCDGTIDIGSKQVVKGVCIDIAPDIVSEVLASRVGADTPFPDISLDTFFAGEDFLENKYEAGRTRLGTALVELGRTLDRNPTASYTFGDEFYFTLAEHIVEDHRHIWQQLYRIRTVKPQTRKDLYRKLVAGKEYLDTHFTTKLTIRSAAVEAALSEYHFFRLFKAVFACSPQQYIIRKRLEAASDLLRAGEHSVADIALAVGFADSQSFGKAFKKHRGISPSAFQEQYGVL